MRIGRAAAEAPASPASACHRAASILRNASSRGSAAITAQSSGPRSLPVSAIRSAFRLPPTAFSSRTSARASRAAVGAFDQLAEALQRLGRVALGRLRRREDRLRVLACLVQVARTTQRGDDLDRSAGTLGKLLVGHRLDRLDREPPDARQVVVHVVLRDAELLEIAADGLAGDAGVAQRCDGRAGRTLRELLAVLAEDQAVVDELGRRRCRAPGTAGDAAPRSGDGRSRGRCA